MNFIKNLLTQPCTGSQKTVICSIVSLSFLFLMQAKNIHNFMGRAYSLHSVKISHIRYECSMNNYEVWGKWKYQSKQGSTIINWGSMKMKGIHDFICLKKKLLTFCFVFLIHGCYVNQTRRVMSREIIESGMRIWVMISWKNKISESLMLPFTNSLVVINHTAF